MSNLGLSVDGTVEKNYQGECKGSFARMWVHTVQG